MENEAINVLLNRRSIRKYKPEQITDEELMTVINAGMYAPSGKCCQSPYIIAVQNKEQREAVSKLNAKCWGTDIDPYYGAPTILLVFFGERSYDEEIGILDAGAATTNMLNAAYSIGLGSCWINRPKVMFESEEGQALLKEWGITEKLRGVASIALGYPDCENPAAAPRKADYYKIIK